MPVAARPRSASSEDERRAAPAPRRSRGRRGRRSARRPAPAPAGRRSSAVALAAKRALRSIGASRIASKPPSSRSATKRRLTPSRAAKSSVAQSTPAARLPERLVRSRPKRKMTKVVVAKSAIAGSDCRVRSSARRSLARIVGEGGARGRHAGTALPPASSRSTWSASASKRSGSWLTMTRVRPGAGADQRPGQLAALGVEVGVGLVEQQQLGLVQDAAADRQALAHPGRELGDPLARRGAPSRPRRAARSIRASAASPRIPCRRAWKRRFSRPLRSR